MEEEVVNVSQIYGNYDNIVNVQSVKQNSIYWETFLRGSGWKSHAILFVLDNIFHSLDNNVGVETGERVDSGRQPPCASLLQIYSARRIRHVWPSFAEYSCTARHHREWRNDPPRLRLWSASSSEPVRPGKYRTLQILMQFKVQSVNTNIHSWIIFILHYSHNNNIRILILNSYFAESISQHQKMCKTFWCYLNSVGLDGGVIKIPHLEMISCCCLSLRRANSKCYSEYFTVPLG